MIKLKTPADIAELAEAGAILSSILDQLVEKAVPGAIPTDLDQEARQLIATADCIPAFLNFPPNDPNPFPAALIISVNEGLVHGVPTKTPIADGDVVKLDLGLIYQDKYYVDSARTVLVGDVPDEVKQLNDVTKQALDIGIAQAQVGNTTGDIGAAVQKHVEDAGYGVVRSMVGHGVGFEVHEEPKVPNFGEPGGGVRLDEGLVIAIEPMTTFGDPEVRTAEDGWTVEAVNGKPTVHWEHTVAVTAAGPKILTTSDV